MENRKPLTNKRNTELSQLEAYDAILAKLAAPAYIENAAAENSTEAYTDESLGAELAAAPEIASDEFEAAYLWFYS